MGNISYIDKIRSIKPEDYSYNLPPERIASHPLKNRDESKLLIANPATEEISHSVFKNISDYLPDKSFLIINTTKVFSARIIMQKPTGGKAEVLCVEPFSPSADPQISLAAGSGCSWECIIGGKRIRAGMTLKAVTEDGFELRACIIEKNGNEACIAFNWQPHGKTFAEIIDKLGATPLPPYIKREAEPEDKKNYQTVYAIKDGSVAAPTAGLHFTEDALNKINEKGININSVILHVGPGTFKPVNSESIGSHNMHKEKISVSKDLIIDLYQALKDGTEIIATGTTTLRTIESVWWFGMKLLLSEDKNIKFSISQWEAYEMMDNCREVELHKPVEAVINYMNNKQTDIINGDTSLLIVPGYDFKTADILITNFHMPKSTLILLVAAFIGKEMWKEVYQQALDKGYRFLSYGDSSLLFRK